MMTRILAAIAILGASSAALAEPAYSSKEIEAHFTGAMECPAGQPCIPKRNTRAVCIGTASECEGQQTAAAADPGGFDMLITFDLGSDRLSAQAKENLAEFAKALKGEALSDATFNIDGHTDARGPDAYNMDLSNRRAESVVRYLESLGIPRSRLEAQGHGETSPRVDDPFAAINRRVEATLRLR